ncbi:MAG: DUF541 domain-containing protein [Chloroflexi bacterium]|nr:DUF541 domain-containing protein [Chloroflexota bacterium]
MRIPALLLVASMVALLLSACSQEAPRIGPAPSATPVPTIATDVTPTSTPPQPGETQGIAEIAPIPTEIPSQAEPFVVTPSAGVGVTSSGGGSWARLVSSTGFHTAPVNFVSGGPGAPKLTNAPLTQPAEGRLTVSATGKVTVIPDLAFVVVSPEEDYGPYGPHKFSKREEEEITQALAGLGIEAEAIAFDTVHRYEPSSISVAVDMGEIEEKGAAIVDAVESVLERVGQTGVRFGLTEESCDRAVALARRQAIPTARSAADDLGNALGIQTGEVTAVLEFGLPSPFFGGPYYGSDPCNLGGDFGSGPAQPFHTEPEVEVLVALQVSYSIR